MKDILFRVTSVLENALKSLLTLGGAPLWSMGQKDLERPRLAADFLWGAVGLWERPGPPRPGPAGHGGAAVCPEHSPGRCLCREQRQGRYPAKAGRGVA